MTDRDDRLPPAFSALLSVRAVRRLGCATLAMLIALGAPAEAQGLFRFGERGGFRQGDERGQTMRPGRGDGVSRFPDRGGWQPGGGRRPIYDSGEFEPRRPRRPGRPVYEIIEPERPPQHRPRRPVIVEYEEAEPVVRRPRHRPVVRVVETPRRERVQRSAPPALPPRTARPAPPLASRAVIVPAASERRLVADEVLIRLAPGVEANPVLRRHRATLIASRRFELANATILRARLQDGRSARLVLAEMARDRAIAAAQPNYLYQLQQGAAASAEPAPPSLALKPARQPQYVVQTLGLDAIHKLARGERVRVAVIDSGADIGHPELLGVVAGSFDALGGKVPPHAHGTAMAGAILAQAQLQGVAPAARLLAARAFAGNGRPGAASGTTFHIMASLDWAAQQGARVVNLSFAGPQDRLLSQALAGAKAKGMVAVAAVGNDGPKSAPLYPGADPNVIAVTATDAEDKAFADANRGDHVALAAPGVDVLAAEPEGRYAFSSGTSIAAAHVSGLVALILEKRPDLDLDGVRRLLMETARDLGPKGRDPVFGAGRIDPARALARAVPATAQR